MAQFVRNLVEKTPALVNGIGSSVWNYLLELCVCLKLL
ncbi:hCG2043599, isoform CRA_c [Homo sapiens]|uniref:ATP synthase membrane subunit g n=1 Tax=Homo sapiens TaxID=9606 RepID=A0A3B3ISE7_HUMAN|nr:hCG2043599, isoform CRA_c [Homo sapiens]